MKNTIKIERALKSITQEDLAKNNQRFATDHQCYGSRKICSVDCFGFENCKAFWEEGGRIFLSWKTGIETKNHNKKQYIILLLLLYIKLS